MRYPMPKTTRAKLTRLYYELCLVPGIEPRVMRCCADMPLLLHLDALPRVKQLERTSR